MLIVRDEIDEVEVRVFVKGKEVDMLKNTAIVTAWGEDHIAVSLDKEASNTDLIWLVEALATAVAKVLEDREKDQQGSKHKDQQESK